MQENHDEREFNPIEECEMVVENMPKRPEISNGVARAWYHPNSDTINMPHQNSFDLDESYYGVLFHELSQALKTVITKTNAIKPKAPPHNGAVIHHHDHVIEPISFNVKKIRNIKPARVIFIILPPKVVVSQG